MYPLEGTVEVDAKFSATGYAVYEGDHRQDPLGMATGLPGISADTVQGPDCLGVKQEAQAFARLICSRRTNAPLSIGLFGDWGTGKSFFMELLKREITARGEALQQLAARDPPDDGAADPAGNSAALRRRWHGQIAQITFNAWHYAESNLWASLVTRVFDKLARVVNPAESVEDTRARLLAEVSEGKQRRKQAALELRDAESMLAEARAEREQRDLELAELREELAIVEAVAPDETPPPQGERSPAAPERLQVRGPIAALRVTLRWVWSRGRWTRFALVCAVALVGLGGLLTVALWLKWIDMSSKIAMATSALGVLMGVVSTMSAWWALIRPRLVQARKLYAGYAAGRPKVERFLDRAARELLRPSDGALGLARRRFEQAEVHVKSAQLAADEAAAQVARARQMIQRLGGGRRFYDFVRDRDQSDDYRQHLGLVSMIREDFGQLERILQQIHDEGAGAGAPPPVSRIVLYIDDLDRCEPERVVDVLQAVHLLLATPIFVVVVGVDVRWLRRSLTLHYDRLLESPHTSSRDRDDETRPSPRNYLEKIFQIPFSLRPMGAEGFAALVQEVLRTDLEPAPSAPRPAGDQPGPAPSLGRDEHRPVSAAPPDAEPSQALRAELQRDAVLALEPVEVTFMQGLHAVIDTPRLAKTLANTYRLLRAEISLEALPVYLEEQEYKVVLTLLAIQVGRAVEAAGLHRALRRSGDAPRSLGELLREFQGQPDDVRPPGDWAELCAAIVSIDMAGLELWRLRAWIPRVRRFSFNPWPTS